MPASAVPMGEVAQRLELMIPVRKARLEALTECSLTVHPAASGHPVATLGDEGGEERNWLPHLT